MIKANIVMKLNGNLIPIDLIPDEIHLENININEIPNHRLPHLKKCLKSTFLSLNRINSTTVRRRKIPPKK